jgi:hypothetical protein
LPGRAASRAAKSWLGDAVKGVGGRVEESLDVFAYPLGGRFVGGAEPNALECPAAHRDEQNRHEPGADNAAEDRHDGTTIVESIQ